MGGRRWTALFVAVAVIATGLVASAIAAVGAPPPVGFADQEVLGGLNLPTNVVFSPDGRVFVAEKAGVIKVYDSLSDPTASVFADLSTEVYSFGDLGMTGLTLHPNFPATPYMYVTYEHDAPIGGHGPGLRRHAARRRGRAREWTRVAPHGDREHGWVGEGARRGLVPGVLLARDPRREVRSRRLPLRERW